MTTIPGINSVYMYSGISDIELNDFIKTTLDGTLKDTVQQDDGTRKSIYSFDNDSIEVDVIYSASKVKELSSYCDPNLDTCTKLKRSMYQDALNTLYNRHYTNLNFHKPNRIY